MTTMVDTDVEILAISDDGEYRLRLVTDESYGHIRDHRGDPFPYHAIHHNPWSGDGRYLGTIPDRVKAEAGPLLYEWRQFLRQASRSYNRDYDAAEMFARYVRMFHHGAAEVDGDSVWYLLPTSSDEAANPELLRQALESLFAEIKLWEQGEVYGYVLEIRTFTKGAWEPVDSLYGLVGLEFAKEQAMEAWKEHLNGR